MNQDIEIVKNILKSIHISEQMIDILINHLIKRMKDYSISTITPNLLYSVYSYELGKNYSSEISKKFKDYKEFGSIHKDIEKLKSRFYGD
jgi:dihydroorotase